MDTTPRVARQVIPAYRELGGLVFGYRQADMLTGDGTARVDLVLVWDRAELPAATARPWSVLAGGEGTPVSIHRPGLVLDRFDLGGVRVDVTHRRRSVFEGWLRDVRSGRGWEGAATPMPLHAVAGFAYGVLLEDPEGAGAAYRGCLATFPPALVERSREVLAAEVAAHDAHLERCARQGDGWLFHELLSPVLRHALVAWFAAEHRYCPHPRSLHQWVARFAMNPSIAALERGMWAPPVSLARRRELFLTMVERILAFPPPAAGADVRRPR
ncbi:hypothetical protein [Actinopolymorpha pittospori]|uniref:Uncharacterized protein n=1 Tax=Actinopolymorpha pittospori TaxID=648752 RepID=A0A927R8M2_9ACTN|nr:hypothetical protein [Actinopolymorpha pittospori]MBE1606887.1 hypothetical protein [Actinopolymorpha pittospori]